MKGLLSDQDRGPLIFLALYFCERVDKHLYMAFRSYIIKNMGNETLWTDHKSWSNDPHVSSAIIFLLSPNSKGFRDAVLWVRQQGEAKGLLGLKVFMRP